MIYYQHCNLYGNYSNLTASVFDTFWWYRIAYWRCLGNTTIVELLGVRAELGSLSKARFKTLRISETVVGTSENGNTLYYDILYELA